MTSREDPPTCEPLVETSDGAGFRIGETMLIALLVLVPAAMVPSIQQPFDLVKSVLIVAFAPLLAYALLEGESPIRPGAVAGLTITLGIWIVASASLFAPEIAIWGSLERAQGALTWMALLLVFGAANIVGGTSGARRRVAWSCLAGGLVPAAYGLAQWVGLDPWAWAGDAVSPAGGTLGRSNFLGDIMAMLLPVSVALLASGDRRWVSGSLGVLFAVALVATGSRGAFVAATAGLIACAIAMRGWVGGAVRKRALAIMLVLSVGAMVGGAVLVAVWRSHWDPASLSARLTIWSWSLPRIAERPWTGYGPDVAGVLYPTLWSGARIDRAHNLVLDTLLSFGVVGLAVMALLIGIAALRGWRFLRETRDPVVAGLLGTFVAFLVATAVSFGVVTSWLVFWVAAGVLSGLHPPGQTCPEAAPEMLPGTAGRRMRHSMALRGMSIAATAALGAVGVAAVAASGLAARSQAARSSGAPAVAEASRAVRLAPYRVEYRVELARAVLVRAAATGSGPDAIEAATVGRDAMFRSPRDPYVALAAGEVQRGAAALGGASAVAEWAEQSFLRAISLDPRLVDARRALGEFYLERGRLGEAENALHSAIVVDESHAPSYEALGRVLLAKAEPGLAADAFARAAVNDPDMAAALLGHGRALCADGKRDEGRERIESARALATKQGDLATSGAALAAIELCQNPASRSPLYWRSNALNRYRRSLHHAGVPAGLHAARRVRGRAYDRLARVRARRSRSLPIVSPTP